MARASTGTMRQRKPGIWELAVSVQKSQAVIDSVQRFSAAADWLSGESPKPKQQRRYETFQGTKAEAEARLREMQVGADRGDLPRSNVTVGEWLAHWLKNYVAEQLAENTLRTYTWLVDQHIGPRIGSLKLDSVRAVDVEALLSDVRKEAPGSGQLAYQALNGAFERAVKMDLLRDNPVRKADKPKAVADKEIIPPRREQVEAFLEASAAHPYHALYFTLAATGLRIGEALGLRWDNVTLRERGSILYVREQQINAGAGMKLAGLKTKASRRAIPLTGDTVKVL